MDKRLAISTASVIVFLGAWEVAPRLGLVDPFFTSRPSQVIAAAADVVRSGTLLHDADVSLSEFAIGFALAVAVGVPLGLLLGTFETLRLLLDPPIMAVYATPQLALLPGSTKCAPARSMSVRRTGLMPTIRGRDGSARPGRSFSARPM